MSETRRPPVSDSILVDDEDDWRQSRAPIAKASAKRAFDLRESPKSKDLDERPTKRMRAENIVIEDDSIEAVESQEGDDEALLRKFKGTPQKERHSSQSQSSSQITPAALVTANPVTPLPRPSLSAILNESAKKITPPARSTNQPRESFITPLRPTIPPRSENVLQSSSKKILNALNSRPQYVPSLSPFSSQRSLSPVPIANVNLRFLDDEDSPIKTKASKGTSVEERQNDIESQRGVENDVIIVGDGDDEIEVEEVIIDLNRQDGEVDIEEFSEESVAVAKSFDSIDAVITSRGEIGRIPLPNIFGEENLEIEHDGPEEEEVMPSPPRSPGSPYRAPHKEVAQEKEGLDEPLTMREVWMASYKSNNPFSTPRDSSQAGSSFLDKLSVDPSLVSQARPELADYPPMTSLVKSGLAAAALEAIEASRRRASVAIQSSQLSNEGEGPWLVVDRSPVSFGFIAARCVHVEDPDIFCDLLFKPHKRHEWESPAKSLKGVVSKVAASSLSSQALYSLLSPGIVLKPLGSFDYRSHKIFEAPRTPTNNPDEIEEDPSDNRRGLLLVSNFETVVIPNPPRFDLAALNSSKPFHSVTGASEHVFMNFSDFDNLLTRKQVIAQNRTVARNKAAQNRTKTARVSFLPSTLSTKDTFNISGFVLRALVRLTLRGDGGEVTSIDELFLKKFKELSLKDAKTEGATLFVQSDDELATIVEVSFARRDAMRFASALHEIEGCKVELRGLKRELSPIKDTRAFELSRTVAKHTEDKLKPVSEFPDEYPMEVEEKEASVNPVSFPRRVGFKASFLTSSDLIRLSDGLSSEIRSEFDSFDSVLRHLDNEAIDKALRGPPQPFEPKRLARVSLAGFVSRILFVPNLSLKSTEFLVVAMIDEKENSISFAIPSNQLRAPAVSSFLNKFSNTSTASSTSIRVSNLLVAEDRLLFDDLSSIHFASDRTIPRPSLICLRESVSLKALEPEEFFNLPLHHRYSNALKVPDVRIVGFFYPLHPRDSKSDGKVHQPIVFKCEHGHFIAPIKKSKRFGRLFPELSKGFAFVSENRGVVLAHAKAEYRLTLVVEALLEVDGAPLCFILALPHSYVAQMLDADASKPAALIDHFFLTNLPRQILKFNGKMAMLVKKGHGEEHLETYELLD